jgi:crotonobetainyl-CoA:carnitine CoA-transferase CaiB-like acyl-CoA transferase
VLDLGTFIAGTFGATILADLGADVVKVEGLDGDPYRYQSVSFMAVNRGKRSVALDLKRPDDLARVLALAGRADVVLENFRPGVTERLGLTDADLRRGNSGLVTCSVSAWGEDGPMASMPGFDLLVGASSGITAAGGAVGLVHDIGTATLAALGCVIGLFHRSRTGEGQRVTTSLANQSVLCQAGELTRASSLPPVERTWATVPHDGGWVVTTPTGTATVLDSEAFLTDPWVADNRLWSDVDDVTLGRCRAVRTMADWEGGGGGFAPWAPSVGQHTAEVLAELD